MMATDYQIDNEPYNTSEALLNADYSCTTKPSNDLNHGIECDPKQRPTELLFNINGNTKENSTLYTLGNFQLATEGVAASGVLLGKLWIHYDITFFKKQLNPTNNCWANWTGSYTTPNQGTIVQNTDSVGYWRHSKSELTGVNQFNFHLPPLIKGKYEMQVYITCPTLGMTASMIT